jgi:hypothetical protein
MKRLTSTLFLCACFFASCQKYEGTQNQPAIPTQQVLMLVNETTINSLSEESTAIALEKESMLREASERRLKEYEKANARLAQSAAAQGSQSR